MPDHLEAVATARAALVSGEVRYESVPIDGQDRWGLAMVLRPGPAMLDTLAALAGQIATVAGDGHWAHGRDLLHVSLRTLAPYRERIDTTQIGEYAAALDDAVGSTPQISAFVRTVNPHPGGVGVHVHPRGSDLDELHHRLGDALRRRGLPDYDQWTRDIWYINVFHFAGPVDVDRLLAWADPRRDLEFGGTTLTSAELVRYRHTGSDMSAETLHRTPFKRSPLKQ